MSKYVFDESHSKFDIEDALTISKGQWQDNNPNGYERMGVFVTSTSDGSKVKVAGKDDYVCGVTVANDVFLGDKAGNSAYCVIQSLGVCVVKYAGTLNAGDNCMPGTDGKAIKSTNNLGYRVVGKVDDEHVEIIIYPNNDMIQRIKADMENIPVIHTLETEPSNNFGNDGEYCVVLK